MLFKFRLCWRGGVNLWKVCGVGTTSSSGSDSGDALQSLPPVAVPSDEMRELWNRMPPDSCVDSLSLDIAIGWPLAIVLQESTSLLKYKFLFQALLSAKHVEWSLTKVWLRQKQARLRKGAAVESATTRKLNALLYCMLDFVKAYQRYMMLEVVECEWRKMEKRFAATEDFDAVLLHHQGLVDECMKRCMLTNPLFIQLLAAVFRTCRATSLIPEVGEMLCF